MPRAGAGEGVNKGKERRAICWKRARSSTVVLSARARGAVARWKMAQSCAWSDREGWSGVASLVSSRLVPERVLRVP
eukprot:scaffold5186_cov48-Phaeocystis_antarctica.AAC.1